MLACYVFWLFCAQIQLYDVFDIDQHTFATILEYCDGIDLDIFLKKNKVSNANYLLVRLPRLCGAQRLKQVCSTCGFIQDHACPDVADAPSWERFYPIWLHPDGWLIVLLFMAVISRSSVCLFANSVGGL